MYRVLVQIDILVFYSLCKNLYIKVYEIGFVLKQNTLSEKKCVIILYLKR